VGLVCHDQMRVLKQYLRFEGQFGFVLDATVIVDQCVESEALALEGSATVLALTPWRVGSLMLFKHQIPHTVAEFQATVFEFR